MKKYLLAPAVLLLLSFYLAQTHKMNASDTGTGIEGAIVIGPVHGGPIRQGMPESKPLADMKFIVQKEGEEAPIASFTTDGEGKFHVAVPPGKYTVVRDGGKRFGRYGPFEVEVTSGKMTSVRWDCDSGMR